MNLECDYWDAPGDLTGTPLSIPKAAALEELLRTGAIDFAEYRESRKTAEGEAIVFEVEVQRGQVRRYDIRGRELICAVFSPEDERYPEVYALRRNFPSVPHINLCIQEFPRSLCLYVQPYAEIKRSWTPARFVERIRWWLAQTSRGDLHGEDQPLEPLLSGHVGQIILPSQFFIGADRVPEVGALWMAKEFEDSRFVLYEGHLKQRQEKPRQTLHATCVLEGAPSTHGVIRRIPQDLKTLHDLGRDVGLDILGELRRRLERTLKELEGENGAFLNAPLLLVIRLPKRRRDDGEVESVEHVVFITREPMSQVGEILSLWAMHEGEPGLLLSKSEDLDEIATQAKDIKIEPLRPLHPFNSLWASIMNGYERRAGLSIVAIGAGALGSQVISNLNRSGFGDKWTIIDHDRLLPHNLARHSLGADCLGRKKAESLAHEISRMCPEDEAAVGLGYDFLAPSQEEADSIAVSMGACDLVLDLSASVEVARTLAHEPPVNGRRISLFLSPSGQDLVLLDEGSEQTVSLDELEMQYYREVAGSSQLSNHFALASDTVRYGTSCRDVSGTISQDRVALHAAIGSKMIRELQERGAPTIAIWRINDDLSVSRFEFQAQPARVLETNGWKIVVDALVCEKISSFREEKLPVETGGVLIGTIDLERSTVYVVDVLPSPPDSEEWPNAYIRGSSGLKRNVDRIEDSSGGILHYLGEWHSHPNGSSTCPSEDDMELFSWLSDKMTKDGLPPLVAIAGDKNLSLFIQTIEEKENPLP